MSISQSLKDLSRVQIMTKFTGLATSQQQYGSDWRSEFADDLDDSGDQEGRWND